MANSTGQVFTYVPNSENVKGKRKEIDFDLVGPTSYQQGGGIPVGIALARMKVIISADPVGANQAGLGNDPYWDPSIQGLRVRVSSTGLEVANGVNLSTMKWRIHMEGY